MSERDDIARTLDGTAFGSSLKDLEDGDLTRGFSDAMPEGNYEGSLDPEIHHVWPDDGGPPKTYHCGTRHAGHIEPDCNRDTHGDLNEYGFLRRPLHGSDVERN